MLLGELEGLEDRGVDTSKLLISADAHLLMPYHVAIDKVTERYMGSKKIGTTGRSIGPCYQDKIARIGIRVADVLDPQSLTAKIEAALDFQNQVLVKIYNLALSPHEVVDTLLAQAEGFKPGSPTPGLLLAPRWMPGETVLPKDRRALCSTSITGPIRMSRRRIRRRRGCRVGHQATRITTVLGNPGCVHDTRVGSGPFPTELFDAHGEYLAQDRRGDRRDDGAPPALRWFDSVIARYATRVNGITDYFITKLDVLSSLENRARLRRLHHRRKRTDEMPMTQGDIARAEPIYEELPGWWEDISQPASSTTCPPRRVTM